MMERRIVQGQWPVGSWLPATRELADQFGVSRKTVQGALDLLQGQNLIARQPRQGCFVRSTPRPIETRTTQKTQIGIISTGGQTAKLALPPLQPARDWGWSIIAGAQEEMGRAGKLMTIIPRHLFDADPVAAVLERVQSVRDSLAGLICFPVAMGRQMSSALLKGLDELQIPYVTINRFCDSLLHNFVSADFQGGTRLAGRCLARMGVRRVLMLETDAIMESYSELERVGGLFQGYALEGAPTQEITLVRAANYHSQDGYEAVRRYLKDHPHPQAVLAMGDLLGIGAMEAIKEAGLRIPQDVAVMGGTGIQQASEAALTTLSQPMQELGRTAMRMLLEMERADTTRMTGRIVRGELTIRRSMLIPEAIVRELANESQTWTFKREE